MDAERIHELFAPIGTVTIRRMFGGAGIYSQGVMFALEADGEVYLKVDEETRNAFSKAGSRPFTYAGKGKPVTMSYWLLPEAAHEDTKELARWAGLALQAAVRSTAIRKRAHATFENR